MAEQLTKRKEDGRKEGDTWGPPRPSEERGLGRRAEQTPKQSDRVEKPGGECVRTAAGAQKEWSALPGDARKHFRRRTSSTEVVRASSSLPFSFQSLGIHEKRTSSPHTCAELVTSHKGAKAEFKGVF